MTSAPGRASWPSRAWWLAAAAALCACPSPPTPDAGPVDAGVEPTACALPESCREAGVDGVCRAGFCQADVPCGEDVECGLGERCQGGRCRFTGCVRDADCPTNKCLAASYSCVECGTGADCPRDKPVCSAGNVCVACSADAQCTVPGPGHCSPAGACVHCLADEHCPNGLTCGAGGVCQGAPLGAACPEGIACAAGLICVLVGQNPQCLTSCDLYSPTACRTGEICYKLTYSGSTSLVFESAGPIGVCFQPLAGARGLREACTRSATGTNCQPT
ncbi:MAG: hypothetical protein HY906_01930, partial [Deltaproteobacteria bacterium]|nr:hypothetical protein [Deltaproteobacteria bacterium]